MKLWNFSIIIEHITHKQEVVSTFLIWKFNSDKQHDVHGCNFDYFITKYLTASAPAHGIERIHDQVQVLVPHIFTINSTSLLVLLHQGIEHIHDQV